MFRKEEPIQMNMNDRMLTANDQTLTAVNGSRAKIVGDVIYPNIDESKFASFFSEKNSRPNILIRRYVAALLLKRVYMLSDANFFEFLRSGALNLQYALHTTQEDKQPLSESSLRRFRRNIENYNKEHDCDLLKEEYLRISRSMAVDMGLLPADPSCGDDDFQAVIVRMDSMEIESHAKAMGRMEIIYTANIILIRYLLKKDFKEIIPEELSHYYKKGDKNRIIYHRQKEDKEAGRKDTRLQELVNEMVCLNDVMQHNFTEAFLSEIPEYKTFQRVFDEQTIINAEGKCAPKANKDISANSVQNPFDTNATYRNKRGPHHGYVMNVAEAVDDKGNGIVIDADIDCNTVSDTELEKRYLERQPDGGNRQILSGDGAYNSEEIEKLANEKNVSVQTTSLTGQKPYDIDADFKLSEDGQSVISCPKGYAPTKCKYNAKTGMIKAEMPGNCCASCPHRDECNIFTNKSKTKTEIHISERMIRRSRQARSFSTEEGQKNARRRNGVEGIMSVMRRKYHIDSLPVFGMARAKDWIWMTLLAYNISKYLKFQKMALAS